MTDFEKFSDILRYDPETGKLFWKRCGRARQIGPEAGSLDGKGYRRVCIDYVTYRSHRVVWLLHYGIWPSKELDHINRDKLDNRIENLREVSGCENMGNTAKVDKGKSGIHGVHPSKGRWKAVKRRKHLGCFATKEEARAAWEAAP